MLSLWLFVVFVNWWNQPTALERIEKLQQSKTRSTMELQVGIKDVLIYAGEPKIDNGIWLPPANEPKFVVPSLRGGGAICADKDGTLQLCKK